MVAARTWCPARCRCKSSSVASVITRGPGPAVPSDAAASRAKTGPIDVTAPPKAEVKVIAFTEVLQFRQEWFGLGHALGEIRYSLALAPGEAMEIAVVDWSRQDEASRTDTITETNISPTSSTATARSARPSIRCCQSRNSASRG